jgi:hypothetical protein
MMDLKTLSTRYTTWVVLIVSALAAYWLQLPAAEQAALIEAYPWLKHVAPLAAVVSFLVARVIPQGPKPEPPAEQDTQKDPE